MNEYSIVRLGERAKKLYKKSCMKLLLGAFLVIFYLFAVGISAQEIYRWVGENGSIHFTDKFRSIPQKYRHNVEKRIFRSAQKATHHLTARSQPVSSAQKIVIPLTRNGNLIIVDGTVNGRDTIKFILDTGAELTLIPRSLVQQLAISLDSSIATPVTGIGGTIIAPRVKIGSLKVGAAEVRNLDVVIIENALLTGQGLLGGNFLGKFRVDIDYTKNQLILERKVGTGE